ncbi:d-xylulose kinase [Grosmannia clavigera kw1407]|uniref:Xylulose kinase n=1 Tax=Grosmannia clavigera (strain kw1407 / UAMH 11150) TaxID=655863 RepID=F0XAD5_GROCL|nr:d-xylulose kinase [Grosmannia clavigera kw1407]EFX05538.1 d-xylulose kinase [Grosmannia clavigera kw1407]
MATSDGPLYLGLDLSTQQLKAIVVASDLSVVAQVKVDFDKDFGAKYGLTKGVLTNEAEGEVYAPVALFLEAIDLVLARLKTATANTSVVSRIRAISGSCQQHGSVYWAAGAAKQLAGLADRPDTALAEQLTEAFSRPWAPNWQDQSTQAECDEFDGRLPGGAHGLASATGSAAHHRFTGPQIMRIRRHWPDVYAATTRISLVSSFVASVLMGALAPLDVSDVCGMDLWDMQNQAWSQPLLELAGGGTKADGEGLRSRLGDVRIDGGGSMGAVSSYFVQRYGLPADCQIAPFTGDNPATILALPLRPLDAIVSLGTSTTFLMVTPHYKPDPSYHFFNHPTTPGQYMFMLCYKNGGLAREKVRDALPPAKDDSDVWATFNKAVLDTPVLGSDPDRAHLGLYFYLNEIVPNIPAGTWRYSCGRADGGDLLPVSDPKDVGWSPVQDARVIVESQALSMRLRSQALVHDVPGSSMATTTAVPKLPAQPRRIYLVGGGSLNPAIARVLGEVLGGTEGVYRLDVGGNACALGGAYKALWAMERAENETFDDLIGRRWKPEGAIEKVGPGYLAEPFAQYGDVLKAFEKMEQEILQQHAKVSTPKHATRLYNGVSTRELSAQCMLTNTFQAGFRGLWIIHNLRRLRTLANSSWTEGDSRRRATADETPVFSLLLHLAASA